MVKLNIDPQLQPGSKQRSRMLSIGRKRRLLWGALQNGVRLLQAEQALLQELGM
jgi:hypothetical protein